MGFINDHVPGKVHIGRIDLMQNFSFFEVPEENARQVVKAFKGLYVDDRRLVVEIAQDTAASGGGKNEGSWQKRSKGNGKSYRKGQKK